MAREDGPLCIRGHGSQLDVNKWPRGLSSLFCWIFVGRRTSVEFITGKSETEDDASDLEQNVGQPGGTATQRTGLGRSSVSTAGLVSVAAVGAATAKQAATRGRRTIETAPPGSDVQ